MSKSFNYIIVVTFLMIGLAILGISQGTTGGILEAMSYNNPGNFKFGALFESFLNVFTLGGVTTGIVLTLLVNRSPDSAIKAVAAGLFTGWIVSDFVSVIQRVGTAGIEVAWLTGVLQGLIFVMMAGFVFAMVSWWAGSDG